MKKNVKYLLIMLAVLVVLGGAAAVLLLAPQSTEEGEESAAPVSAAETVSTPQEILIDRDVTDVTAVDVENKEGSFRMVPTGEGATFTIEGYEKYDLNLNSISTAVSSLTSVKATKDLGDRSGSLEEFGLAGEEASKIKVAYKDGSVDEMVLGITPAESLGHYMLWNGTVYIVPSVSSTLCGSKFGYFNKNLYTIADRTEETEDKDGNKTTSTVVDRMQRLRLSGTAFPEEIEIIYNFDMMSSYQVTEPVMAESGGDRFVEMIGTMKTLTAQNVVAAGLTPGLLEEFGLAEPAAVADFELNSVKHKLTVSAKNPDQTRYLLIDDNDVIYQVANSSVSSWAETNLTALRMSYIWLVNIMYVEKLSYTLGDGTKYWYDVTRVLDEEKTTDSTNKFYTLTIKNKAGDEIEYEYYQDMYQMTLGVAVMDQTKPAYGGTPDLKIEYKRFKEEGDFTDTVEFFAVGEDRYAAQVNGMFSGQVRRSELDKLISKLPDLDAGLPVQ